MDKVGFFVVGRHEINQSRDSSGCTNQHENHQALGLLHGKVFLDCHSVACSGFEIHLGEMDFWARLVLARARYRYSFGLSTGRKTVFQSLVCRMMTTSLLKLQTIGTDQ